jgi:hypothetical protein
MQSHTRKGGGTIKSLLIEHTKLDKTAARLASEHAGPKSSPKKFLNREIHEIHEQECFFRVFGVFRG